MSNFISSLVLLIQFASCFSESELQIIELDHDLGHDTPFFNYPGGEPFSYEVIEASNNRGFWLAFGKYTTMGITGTYVLAPYTYNEQGLTVDEIPVEQYFGEACVIDITDKVASDYNYELSEQDVRDWVYKNGVFTNNSFVLVYTGWEKGRYPDQKLYFGDDKGNNFQFPGISADAMRTLLSFEQSHGINLIAFGIDAPRLENGPSKNRDTSALVSNLNKYIIANLRNLESLPTKGARLLVTPLKIRSAPSSQARVLARLPYSS